MRTDIFNFKFWYFLLLIVLLYALITYLANCYIYTESFYYTSLSNKLDISRIAATIELQHKFRVIGYLFIPVVLILKLWIIAGILFTGLYLFQQEVNYRNCLKITLIAELVSVVAVFIKTSWLIINPPSNVTDLQYFSPLSITQLINIDKLPKYFFYPLQLFNVFELVYWIVLVFGIMAFTPQKWSKSLQTVASSYGIALSIWAVFVVFIQVQFT